MAQFSQNMSKEELVNAFSTKSPFLGKMSVDGAYNYIVRQYPQYKLDSEETAYKPATSKKKNIWDSLPAQIRKGYNDSIQGMAYEMATGNKRFDISDYEEGIVNDLAAGVASFFAPVDFATTIAGGGIGGAATKSLVKKFVFKKLVNNGALKTTAGRAAVKAGEFASKVGAGAGTLGLYSGAGDALQQKITDGTINVGRVVKTGVKGAILGGMTGGTNAYLTKRGAKTLTKVGAEIGTFGIGAPVLEGEMPTPQDFLHAGSMIAGIKGVNWLGSKGLKEVKKFADSAREAEYRTEIIEKGTSGREELFKTASEARGLRRLVQEKEKKVWENRRGQRGIIVSEGPEKIQFKPFGGESKGYVAKNFFNTFRSKDRADMSVKDIKKNRIDDIRNLEKELGHKKKVRETNRVNLMEKTDTPKKPSLENLSNQSLVKLRDKLSLELYSKEAIKDFEKLGIKMIKPRVSMFMDKIFPEKVSRLFDVIRPAKNQGSVDQMRRAYIGLADTYFTDYRRFTAQAHDLMSKNNFLIDKPTPGMIRRLSEGLGVSSKSASDNYWTLLTEAVENGVDIPEVTKYKSITDYIYNNAKQSGVNIPGYFDRYIPRILKQDVATAIFADIQNLAKFAFPKAEISKDKKIREGVNSYQQLVDMMLEAKENPDMFIKNKGNEARFLNRMIKLSLNKFESDYTKRGLSSLIEEGGELKYFKAYSRLARETSGELFRIDGNIERSRKLKLPTDFYERDAKKLLAIYSSNTARRSAEVKNFGREGEVATSLFKNATDDDRQIMKELHRHVMGDIAHARDYNYNPAIKNFLKRAVEWETATKIGLGTASAMNLSQFTISSALSAGYWRFGKGAYKYYTDDKFRKQVDASGADLYRYIDEMLELSNKDALTTKLVTYLTDKSQFNRINSYNNILAASAARVFVDDLVAVVSGNRNIFNPGQLGSKKWARATLVKMGIEPKHIKQGKVNESAMLNALSKFAIDTQLQKNVLSDPLVFNRPTWKPFLQFKSFGYRQYNFIRDTLRHDALHYNVFPMLRLAGAGFATGAISLKAKEYMKYLVSGEKSYDPSRFLETDGEEIIENIAAVGAFGYLGDFLTSALEEGKSYSRALTFLATPAIVSDIDNFLNSFIPALERDYKNYEGDFIKRVPARLLKLTGSPLLKDLAKRKDIGIGQTTLIDVPIETKGMRKDRITFLRGRRKSALLDKLVKANTPENYKEVIRDIKQWNSVYPNYKINVTDIDNKAIMKRKIQKWKKKQNV